MMENDKLVDSCSAVNRWEESIGVEMVILKAFYGYQVQKNFMS